MKKKKKKLSLKEQRDQTMIYHVSQSKDAKTPMYKKWRVRLSGSDKTIKYFDTQKEAIELAKSLADKNKGRIVIHMLNGKTRKQNY